MNEPATVPAEDRYDRREGLGSMSLEDVASIAGRCFPGRTPRRVSQLAGGYSNANYLVDLGAERFVLRFFLGGEEAGEREIGALRLARSHGVAVPQVVDYQTHEGRAVAVLEFVEGMLLSKLLQSRPEDSETIFFNVGQELARIHAVKFPGAGLFGASGEITEELPDVCAAARQYLLGPLAGIAGQRLGSELTERVRQIVDEHWHLVNTTCLSPALVHCDFNPKNILVSEGADRRVAAILDWEFSMSAHAIIDLGNFFRFEQEDYPPGSRAAFLQGYSSGGGILPSAWERAARLVDLTSMLAFLSRPQESPKTFRTARKVIERTLDDVATWRPKTTC
jgi:Ser/Thr protein kinase RdoA (MazF antagonist)